MDAQGELAQGHGDCLGWALSEENEEQVDKELGHQGVI